MDLQSIKGDETLVVVVPTGAGATATAQWRNLRLRSNSQFSMAVKVASRHPI
jgi:hypothetical protein